MDAGRTEKAVGYWLTAGQKAVARSAMTEAVAQLQKGLRLLASLPDGSWHQQQELDLLVALGKALSAAKGFSAPETAETSHERERCPSGWIDPNTSFRYSSPKRDTT
jgi:predicted ATPase